MSQVRWDRWRSLFHLEQDAFFIENATLFDGTLNSRQAEYLHYVNPLTDRHFTPQEIFKMQHIPLMLKSEMLPIIRKNSSLSEFTELFETTDLIVTESLELEAKAIVAEDGARCIAFSYNFFQFLRNLIQILTLSSIKDPADLLVSDQLFEITEITEDEFHPLLASITLKHKLMDDYKNRRFQRNLPFSFSAEYLSKAVAMTHALELFFVGHELAHFALGHVEKYTALRSYRKAETDDPFRLVSRHLSKAAEFEADWVGYQFAAHYTDELFPPEQRSRSNDVILDLVWQFFSFLTQTGDFGSDSYPVPADRAHVLFLRAWGNQAKIPQFLDRAQQIRSLYTLGAGIAEVRVS